MAITTNARNIGAAGQVIGDGEGEISLPTEIIDIIVMKMYGAVMLRSVTEAHILSRPVCSGHSPRRKVNDPSV